MFNSSKTACPKCKGDMLRKSHWKSHDEKRTHQGLFPHRCISCGHRFLAPEKGKHTLTFLGLGIAASIMILIVALAGQNQGHRGSDSFMAQGTNATSENYQAITAETILAAETGNADAQYRLGRNKLLESAYDAAKGTEAVLWLTQSAENGHSGAMTRLGKMYQSGVGVLQNYELSVMWLNRAARKGDPIGMLEYGRLYRDGIGVDKDLIQAYAWMNRAAAASNITAVREREAVSLMLDKTELRQAQRLSMEPYDGINKQAHNGFSNPSDRNEPTMRPAPDSQVGG